MTDEILIETHPWRPFVPENARILILGTFPPPQKRWAMDFYYPNRTNDFWPMMGLIFFGDRDALIDRPSKGFRLDRIRELLSGRGIAIGDTARRVQRLRGNASDKYLEIVEPLPLAEVLSEMPLCKSVASTGEKAAGVIASLTDTAVPAMGHCVRSLTDGLTIWRMPSTSRAYPLPLAEKAAFYAAMFRSVGIL